MDSHKDVPLQDEVARALEKREMLMEQLLVAGGGGRPPRTDEARMSLIYIQFFRFTGIMFSWLYYKQDVFSLQLQHGLRPRAGSKLT